MRRPLGAAALGRRGGSPAAAALGMTPIQHDRWHDLAAGHAVGAKGILVRTGVGRKDEAEPHPEVVPDAIADLDPIGTRDEDPGVINSDFGAGGRPRGQRPGGRGSSGRDAGATARHSHRATVTSPDP